MLDNDLFEHMFKALSTAIQLDEKVKRCRLSDVDPFVCEKFEQDLRNAKVVANKTFERYVHHLVAEERAGIFERVVR